jgi:hypothetical protein
VGGIITEMENPYLNLQSLGTDGLDIELSYNLPVGEGDLTARFLANRVFSYTVSDGVTEIDRSGDISLGQPKWSGNATLQFSQGRLGATADIVYLGSGSYNVTYDAPNEINDNSIPSRTFVNFQIQYDVGDEGQQREVFFNVSNLFNERPPAIFLYSGGPNYDRIGRAYRLGFRFRM